MTVVSLAPLTDADKEQFIKDNQEAFNYGALEEFGKRDDHFEEDDQIISRETIEKSIELGEAYRIICDGVVSGGSEDEQFPEGMFRFEKRVERYSTRYV